jgi:hypothetical protein
MPAMAPAAHTARGRSLQGVYVADVYQDVYHDVYGQAGTVLLVDRVDFDGTNGPLLSVQLGLGADNTEPPAGSLILGVGPGLGTGFLGTATWTDITADVISVSITRGRQGELEQTPPGTCSLVMDNTAGTYDPTNPASPFYGSLEVGIPIRVRATWNGVTFDRYYGYIDDIVMDLGYSPTVTFPCVDALERLGRARVGEIAPSYDGDFTGTRIGRILDAAGHPTTLRALDTGRSQLANTIFGDFALPLIEAVNQTELGLVFVDGAGKVVFYNRHRSSTAGRSTTVQAQFTDNGTDADLDVEMDSLEISRPRDLTFNEAHITASFDGAVEQVAFDSASQLTPLGQRVFPGTAGTLLRSDAEALGMAQWLVGLYKTPKQRISSVRVDATTQGLWSVLLPLTLLDRISVTRDYGPNTITAELLIQGFTEEITLGKDLAWTWTFQTSNPADVTPLVLGATALGTGRLAF